jgi:hypothetical protein
VDVERDEGSCVMEEKEQVAMALAEYACRYVYERGFSDGQAGRESSFDALWSRLMKLRKMTTSVVGEA